MVVEQEAIIHVLISLAILLFAAKIFAELFNKLRLPAVLSELLAGIIVWGVLFLPINYLIMEPTLQKLLVESDPSSSQYAMAKTLLSFQVTSFGVHYRYI